jgi:hypothetical protein
VHGEFPHVLELAQDIMPTNNVSKFDEYRLKTAIFRVDMILDANGLPAVPL